MRASILIVFTVVLGMSLASVYNRPRQRGGFDGNRFSNKLGFLNRGRSIKDRFNNKGRFNHGKISIPHKGIVGKWGKWGKWGVCDKPCGGGYQSRSRVCLKPHSYYGNIKPKCVGDHLEKRKCNVHHCKVHGGWSKWGQYSSCSKKCGGGLKTRYRTCTHPKPAYGGNDCYGDHKQVLKCNTHYCPIHGGWSYWTKWSKCSGHCGKGFRTRSRSCINPKPAYGGADCHGNKIHKDVCHHSKKCFVHKYGLRY